MANVLKLDKTRAYGTIGGRWDECPGARFTQDGYYFDVEGRHIQMPDDPADAEPSVVSPDGTTLRLDLVSAEQREGILDLVGLELDDSGSIVVKEAVDIVGWARGDEEHHFQKVRKAMREQFNVAVSDSTGIHAFLLKEGMISENEVAPDLRKHIPLAAS